MFLFAVLLAVGCDAAESSPDDSIINAGASFIIESDLITPMVGVRFTVETNQPLSGSFTVYVGAVPGFAKDWSDDAFGCNPGFGKFAIRRVIENEREQCVLEDYFLLDDFPDDEKYPMHIQPLEDDSRRFQVSFTWSTNDTFDFSSIDFETGHIYYTLGYYDDIKDQPYNGYWINFGAYGGWRVRFQKERDRVIFSL